MQDYTTKEKAAIINLLSLIMEADNIIDPKEVEYMDKVLSDMHVTPLDLDKMENKDIEFNKNVYNEMSLNKRQEAMSMFKHMAAVDGNVDPREMDIIKYL